MSQELVYERGLEDQKQFARFLYAAHGLTFFFTLGALSFLPLIANYLKRPETVGTMVHSHHTWMIRSFWVYIAVVVLAYMVAFTIIGIPLAFLIYGLVWLWKAYRLIRGFIDLNNNRPMPV